jgi:hypothetical protein
MLCQDADYLCGGLRVWHGKVIRRRTSFEGAGELNGVVLGSSDLIDDDLIRYSRASVTAVKKSSGLWRPAC